MDIDVLVQWFNKWLLHFNTDKCKVMSLGHSVHHDYCMTDHSGTHIMSRTSEEKDSAPLSQTIRSLLFSVPKLQPEHVPYSLWSEEISKNLTVKTYL